MTLSEALGKIKAIAQPVFRTADVMVALDIQKSYASKLLDRLAQHGHVIRLKRGRWAMTESLEPLALVPHLTAPFNGSGHCFSGRFDLSGGDPGGFKSLQPVFAELNFDSASFTTGHPASVMLSIFCSFWQQHDD